MNGDTQIEEYSFDETNNFASVLQKKAEHSFLKQGSTKEDAQIQGIKKFNEVHRRRSINFLTKFEKKLASLSNQSVANLLKSLIAMGLTIDDDDELEYWINLLSKETLNRLATYFNQRDSSSLWKQLTTPPKTEKLLYNLGNYSTKEIEALSGMIKSLDKINIYKSKNDHNAQRRSAMLQRMDKTLKKDIQIKNRAEQERTNLNRVRRTEKQESDRSINILKNKMISEGVVSGGNYWNKVINDYFNADNKYDFTNNWSIDRHTHNELDIKPIVEEKIKEQEKLNNTNKDIETIMKKRGIKEDDKQEKTEKLSGKNQSKQQSSSQMSSMSNSLGGASR